MAPSLPPPPTEPPPLANFPPETAPLLPFREAPPLRAGVKLPTILPPASNEIQVIDTKRTKGSVAGATAPNDSVVLICYTDDPDIFRACRSMYKRFIACGIRPILLADKSEEEIRAGVRGLPPNTNVFISSHGVNFSDKAPARSAAELIAAGAVSPLAAAQNAVTFRSEAHLLAVNTKLGKDLGTPWGGKMYIETKDGKVDTHQLKTAEILTALDEELGRGGIMPAKIVSACFSGNVHNSGNFSNVVTTSSWNEPTYSHPADDDITEVESAAMGLLCRPREFAELAEGGVVTGKGFAGYLKKEGLPSVYRGKDGKDLKQTPVLKDFALYPVTPNFTVSAARQLGPAVLRNLRTH